MKSIGTEKDEGRSSNAARAAVPVALDVLLLSVWCGLVAGLLEVGTRVLCRAIHPEGRLHGMSRHFTWLVPLTDLLLFLALGPFMAAATKRWPRWGGFLSLRLIGALAILPALMVAGPHIYAEALLLLALGISARAVPLFEGRAAGLRFRLIASFPLLLACVVMLAGLIYGADRLKEWRERGHPQPPTGAPNVLLIVLDTVRADHLSLYGYQRSTSPELQKLARKGIRFDAARATAPWTLASHASMFTGRWPHELGVRWTTPLRAQYPMLAEYLGSHGYATAGFVGNTFYCSYDTGLDRGFTHYEDYVLEGLAPFRTARLVDLSVQTAGEIGLAISESVPAGPLRLVHARVLRWLLEGDRKDAASVNRDFLAWLGERREPARPFFVFLNYFDAHSPYFLPRGATQRFGLRPQTPVDFQVLRDWREIDKLRLPRQYRELARDCYDDCLAYLDRRLGELFDELERRRLLERTLVIVTSDHGEGFGEHELFFHGESLYGTEVRVPLLVVLPGPGGVHAVSNDVVSLRDLPATIVDLTGLRAGSPFPGRSLEEHWSRPSSQPSRDAAGLVICELYGPNPSRPNQGRSPAQRGPLVSLAFGDFVCIRNQGDGSDELFNEREDPHELTNLTRLPSAHAVLQQFRDMFTHIGAYSSSNK